MRAAAGYHRPIGDRVLTAVFMVLIGTVLDEWIRPAPGGLGAVLPARLALAAALTAGAALAVHGVTRIPARDAALVVLSGSGCVLIAAATIGLPAVLPATHPSATPTAALLLAAVASTTTLLYRANRARFAAATADVFQLRMVFFLTMYAVGLGLAARRAAREHLPGFGAADVPALLLLAVALATGAIFAALMNNLEDAEIDRVSNPSRPLITGAAQPEWYAALAYWMLAATAGLALAAHVGAGLLLLVIVGNYFLYSVPPIKIKRLPIFGKVVVSVNALLTLMLGWAYWGLPFRRFPHEPVVLLLVGMTLGVGVLDLKDYAGDKAAGLRTLPVLVGLRPAKVILSAAIIVVLVMLPLLGPAPPLWLLGAYGLAYAYLILREPFDERPVLGLFLGSLPVAAWYTLW